MMSPWNIAKYRSIAAMSATTGMMLGTLLVLMASGTGFIASQPSGDVLRLGSAVVVMIIASMAVGVLALVLNSLRDEGSWEDFLPTLASVCGPLVAAFEMVQYYQQHDVYFMYALMLPLQGLFVFAVTRLLAGAFHLQGAYASLPAWIVTGLLALWGLATILFQSWVPLAKTSPYLGAVREGCLALAPVVICGYCLVARSLWADPQRRWYSLSLRLRSLVRDPWLLMSTLAMGCGSMVTAGFHVLVIAGGRERGWLDGWPEAFPYSAFNFAWTGIALVTMREFTSHLQARALTMHLVGGVGGAAQRFFVRSMTGSRLGARVLGVRTSLLFVDHDPRHGIVEHMPAALAQMRGEEVYRQVHAILAGQDLSLHTVGSQLTVAVDPEQSMHPVLDAIRVCAVVEAEGSSRVRSVLDVWLRVLPLVNPSLIQGLDSARTKEHLEQHRNLHFIDYDWVDQHLIHTHHVTRYGVRYGGLSAATREAMARFQLKKDRLGQAWIWLSRRAYDRLALESHFLWVLGQSVDLGTGRDDSESRGGGEFVVLPLKRVVEALTQFYDYEVLRSVLSPKRSRREAMAFRDAVGHKLSTAASFKVLLQLAGATASFSWQGFDEKNAALDLLSLIGERGERIRSDGRGDDREFGALRKVLLSGIQTIGYPQQLLHLAQTEKMEKRDVDLLIEHAVRPWHGRFQEAWVLLATVVIPASDSAWSSRVLAWLEAVAENPVLRGRIFVQAKACEVLANVAHQLPLEHVRSRVVPILDRFLIWFVDVRAEAPICGLLMDVKRSLEIRWNRRFASNERVVLAVGAYFNDLHRRHGRQDPWINALLSRWEVFLESGSVHGTHATATDSSAKRSSARDTRQRDSA